MPEEADTVFPNDEAYKISITTDQIKVIGANLRGLHFGMVTLKHLLDMNKPLPVAELIDYPACRSSGHVSISPCSHDTKI